MQKIILASGSPRRSELLKAAGVSFEVLTADMEERTEKTRPWEVVQELARGKGYAVRKKLESGCAGPEEMPEILIAADTIVSLDDEILGKPRDREDAVRMLMKLQGRWHQVYTGVCVLYRKEGRPGWEEQLFYEKTDVEFYPADEKRIRRYVETGEPLDKAGSYAIQGKWMVNVKQIKGDYCNVVGLPVSRLAYETRLHGIDLGML